MYFCLSAISSIHTIELAIDVGVLASLVDNLDDLLAIADLLET